MADPGNLVPRLYDEKLGEATGPWGVTQVSTAAEMALEPCTEAPAMRLEADGKFPTYFDATDTLQVLDLRGGQAKRAAVADLKVGVQVVAWMSVCGETYPTRCGGGAIAIVGGVGSGEAAATPRPCPTPTPG